MWSRGRILGKGSSGTVYLGSCQTNTSEDLILPSVFAVKSSELSKAQSLKKEKIVLDKFKDCPNIVQCFGDHQTFEGGIVTYNIMLEYASYGSLADCIEKSKKGLHGDEAKRYTLSILRGIKTIHDRGYVHRDIKPQNILVMEDHTAKIADFGLAEEISVLRRMKGNEQLRVTPAYTAPEAIIAGELGPAVDIWALGCVVVEMLTRKHLFDCALYGNNVIDMLAHVGVDEPPIPECLSKDVIAMDFVKKCLIKDPQQRWTADALLEHAFISTFRNRSFSKLLNGFCPACG